MSVQSSHEPESFAEAFNHSCWRDAQAQISLLRKDRTSKVKAKLVFLEKVIELFKYRPELG